MLAQMGMDPVAFRESVSAQRQICNLLSDRDMVSEQEANKCVAKRFGTAEDIANLVSFLASPQSDFVTGQSVRDLSKSKLLPYSGLFSPNFRRLMLTEAGFCSDAVDSCMARANSVPR
ncbi:hypothetical protein HWV62_29176 [Athelia sp. TMB]|nr:hypothetical protein HWV62_29176 [Athelia sp. TMB]